LHQKADVRQGFRAYRGFSHGCCRYAITMKDIDKAHEYSDRYLEKHHEREFREARERREEKEREALELKKQERSDRIKDGLELPWMKKNIIREQLEPYKEWKQKQDLERESGPSKPGEAERAGRTDTIEAAGQKWSKANTLEELRGLNEHLWENFEDRIPVGEYRKLTGWIRGKELAEEKGDRDQGAGKEKKSDREKDFFEHDGKKYGSNDSLEKLTGLAAELREKKEPLPIDQYQNLRSWIEDKGRERFAGAIDKEMDRVLKKTERSKTMGEIKSQEGGRFVDPMQEQLMRNPVVGLFMSWASLANQLVRMVPLTENRDHLKDNREDPEKAKADLDKEPARGNEDLDKLLGDRHGKSQHEQKEQKRENIDKGIERNEAAQKERDRKAKDKKEDKERTDRDRENFERGGWY
jgi:hypothetical protein